MSLPPGRYRAFVHYLDREGTVLFTDDHDPDPPPQAWEDGKTYTYRRLVLTPPFPYAGPVTVAMGLYGESGSRLQLSGPDLGQQRVRAGRLSLTPRDRDLPVRCDGLYEPEAAPAAPLAVWRFMGREATCTFPSPKEDVVVFLRADLEPQGFDTPPSLTITSTTRRDGAPWWVSAFPLSDQPRTLQFRVPARLLGKEDDAGFRLRMSQTYVPAALGAGDGDKRELSLRILGLYVARARLLASSLLPGPEARPQ